MQASQVLLQLIGSVALLVWGVRMVRTGVVRALGSELRRFVALSSQSTASAFFSGFAVTSLLQSSRRSAPSPCSTAGGW